MDLNNELFHQVVESLDHHLAIIDSNGDIQFVNQSWLAFAEKHNEIDHPWVGSSYWELCDYNDQVLTNLKRMLKGEISRFSYDYNFHSGQQEHWYHMNATPLCGSNNRYLVVIHKDITVQKNHEQQIRELTLTDSLTTLPNHRHFTQFFEQEWRRGARYKQPLSLLLLDIDHFKMYNDEYGHQQGDVCLQQIGKVLKRFAKRPGDLMARYGGEEFALVMSNTSNESAKVIAADIVAAVAAIKLFDHQGNQTKSITISIGIATQVPQGHAAKDALFQAADKALYQAKSDGRNRFCISKEFA